MEHMYVVLKNAVKDVVNSTGNRISNYKSNGFIYL